MSTEHEQKHRVSEPSPLTRRNFLRTGLAAVGLTGAALPQACTRTRFDLLIQGATILDGTGEPAFEASVGITGDTIEAVGRIDPGRAKRVIEADGLHLCPGFIDIHTHSDWTILSYPTADSRVLQGVTTEVTGNCGGSTAPLTGVDADKRRREFEDRYDRPADWTDVASYFELIEASGISVNHAMLVGHGGLRRNKIGLVDRHLSADEMKAVIRALEEGMDQGAVGLSTGLEYIPGLYTPIEEVIALARVVASREGLYASHIRCESALLLESVNEAIETGSQSGVRVQISHFKAAGRPNWHKQADSLGLIEKAREAGVDIMADAYPYTAYSTGLTYYLEPWAKEGGAEAMVARLHDPGQRARIRRELNLAIANSPGTFDLIVIASVKTEQNKPVIGKNLVEIGDIWDLEPLDVLMRLLEEESDRVSFVGHGMNPENVEMVLAHPQVMIGSDGYSIAPWGKAAESQPHPRSYGTYPRVLGYYARQRRIFDLPTAVKKMTSMPADRMRFTDRGRIGPGMKADLVLFNADTVIDIATFENPHQFPKGIEQVLVNGVTVVENSRHTGARPGRVLRKA